MSHSAFSRATTFVQPRDLRSDLIRLLLLLLPAFLLLLGVRPLSVPDEGRYPEIAREMMLSGDYITPKINGIVFLDKPALYYWLESVSFHLFGVSTWSVRLMPALFGVFGVAIVFVTAWKLFSRRAAWWSAAVLATNPLYFLASQYADMNIEIAVLVTATLCLFLLARRAVETRTRRTLFLAAWVAMGLGVLTKGLIGIVFPALVIGAWTIAGNRWAEMRGWYFVRGTLAMFLVCLPWFVLVQQQNPQFFHHFFIYQQFERFSGHGFNNELPFWFYLPVIVLGLLPWSFWLPSALRRQWFAAQQHTPIAEVQQLLLLWPVLILIFFSVPASKVVGYILPAIPPLALLVGEYLSHRREFSAGASFWKTQSVGAARVRSLRKRVLWMPITGLAICVVAIFGATHFDRTGIAPLAKHLQRELQPGDRLVSYRRYYQDLPLYLSATAQLNRPMLVVDDWHDPGIMDDDNWRREFLIGLRDQPDAHDWLIDENRFAAMLAEPTRTFVLARMRDADELAKKYGLRVAARSGKNVLMIRDTPSEPLVSLGIGQPIERWQY